MPADPINSSHLSFICPMRRSDFRQQGDDYFCDRCRKTVYDLTDCSRDDVIALQREKGTICGLVRVVGAASLLTLASSCAGSLPAPDRLADPALVPGMLPAQHHHSQDPAPRSTDDDEEE